MAKKPIQALCLHLQGLTGIGYEHLCHLFLEEEALKIMICKGGLFKRKYGDTYTINIDRVISVDYVTKENIQEKSKSVVGRGIAGGLIFGPIGAIIGGISGTGSTKEDLSDYFLNIAYYDKNGEIQTMIFKTDLHDSFPMRKLAKEYNERYVIPTMDRNDSGEILL